MINTSSAYNISFMCSLHSLYHNTRVTCSSALLGHPSSSFHKPEPTKRNASSYPKEFPRSLTRPALVALRVGNLQPSQPCMPCMVATSRSPVWQPSWTSSPVCQQSTCDIALYLCNVQPSWPCMLATYSHRCPVCWQPTWENENESQCFCSPN